MAKKPAAKAAKARAKKGVQKKKPTAAERAAAEAQEAREPQLPNIPKIRDFKHHYLTIKGYKERAATANSHLRDARKKAAEAGVDLWTVDEMLKQEREDPIDTQTRYAQLEPAMREFKSPVQIKAFDFAQGSPEDQAGREGYKLGRVGKSPDTNRWPEGGIGHAQHMTSWQKGQRDLGKDGVLGNADQEVQEKNGEGEGE